MTEKKEPTRITPAAARVSKEAGRRLCDAEANSRVFAHQRDALIAANTGRYAVYRQQRFEAVFDTFIEAAFHLKDKDGHPGSIHEITTRPEPGLLKRRPPSR